MFKCISVDAIIPSVHHVVVEIWVAASQYLQSFVTAAGCNDGICGRDCRNDVLDDALSERVGNSRNVEVLCPGKSLLEEPCDMLRVIRVKDFAFPMLFPCNNMGPFDTMLRLTRDGG